MSYFDLLGKKQFYLPEELTSDFKNNILKYLLTYLFLRDQSCTDILDTYNKIKAEELNSTDAEEVRITA